LDTGKLDSLINEADSALPDTDAVLPNLTRASTLLRNTVNDMNGRGSEVLENFQTLLQNAGWVGPALGEITQPLMDMGNPLYRLFWAAYRVVVDTGAPESLRNVGALLGKVQHFLDTRAPDLKVFAEAFTPNIKGIAAAAMNFDTGQLLSNMLDTIPEDGTITLRVRTP
jgi:hypothetical protein